MPFGAASHITANGAEMKGTTQIGNETRTLDDWTENWVNDQTNLHRREGAVCVIVTIKTSGVDIRLSTPACGGAGGGGGAHPTTVKQIC